MIQGGVRPKRRWSKCGAISSAALLLIIMVAIALVAVAIIFAWLEPWKEKVDLASIDADPASIPRGVRTEVTITALDTKGHKLSGVTVNFEGFGASTASSYGVVGAGTTDSTGTVTFNLMPSIPVGVTSTSTIWFNATYTGIMMVEKSIAITVL